MFVDRALKGRTDGALVRVTIPLGRESSLDEAERIFEDFSQQALPGLDPYVPL